MQRYNQFLDVAKSAVKKALLALKTAPKHLFIHSYDLSLPREMKAAIDYELQAELLDSLLLTGIPILSEEASEINLSQSEDGNLRWIIDPLDGTVNFIRGIASSGISIALWDRAQPIFGVIGEYPSLKIAWGGKFYGAFLDNEPIHVSKIVDIKEAIICTGFPSRYQFTKSNANSFHDLASSYAKVRMLGSASISLLNVARGSVDVYSESDVMIWDVAAGIAIVEGAGGSVNFSSGCFDNSLNVFASNGLIR